MSGPDLAALIVSVVGSTLMIGLAGIVFGRWLRWSRARAARRAAEGAPKSSGSASNWIWIFLIVAVAVFFRLQADSHRRARGDDPGPGAFWGVIGLGLALPGLLALLVAVLYVRAYFHPNSRIVRLIAANRLDEAAARLRARVARRRGGSPDPGPGGNPFEAPGALSSPAERQAEADDWNHLGMIAFLREDWPEALACFERAEAIGAPNAFIPRLNRGLVLVAAGRVDEGVALAEEAAATVPAAQAWARATAHLLVAERLIAAGRPDRAGPILDRAEAERGRTTVLGRSSRRDFAARVAAARARVAQGPAPAVPSGGGPMS